MRNYIETDPNYTETFRIKTANSDAFLVMESIYALLLKIFARVADSCCSLRGMLYTRHSVKLPVLAATTQTYVRDWASDL